MGDGEGVGVSGAEDTDPGGLITEGGKTHLVAISHVVEVEMEGSLWSWAVETGGEGVSGLVEVVGDFDGLQSDGTWSDGPFGVVRVVVPFPVRAEGSRGEGVGAVPGWNWDERVGVGVGDAKLAVDSIEGWEAVGIPGDWSQDRHATCWVGPGERDKVPFLLSASLDDTALAGVGAACNGS